MLAQNFKTAADLGVTDETVTGLITVLRMLERKEVVYSDKMDQPNGFNMGFVWKENSCGTVGCIAGWMRKLSNDLRPFRHHPNATLEQRDAADALLMPRDWKQRPEIYTVERAAMALRSYLTLGEPRWDDILQNQS